MWRPFIATPLLLFMFACQAPRASGFCDTSSPIRPSVEDRLTEGTARQILKHNSYGAQACGWKAKP